MPNEGYQRRRAEQEKKERERREAVQETPYDPSDMRGRVPLGCTMTVILGAIIIAYAVYRYFKLHA